MVEISLADPSLHHLDLIREYSRGSSECSGSTNLNRIQSEIQRDYEQLQRSISQEFHRYICIIFGVTTRVEKMFSRRTEC